MLPEERVRQQLMKTEGVVLEVVKFRDHEEILTLFTHDQGILKLIRRFGKKSGPLGQFLRGEFVFYQGRGEIFRCKEVHPLDHNLGVRERYSSIEAACTMAGVLKKTQLNGKPAPELYQIFCHFLKHLSQFDNPKVLSASFILKVLRLEGLLTFEDPHFSYDEIPYVQVLAFSRKLTDLQSLAPPEGLISKIDDLLKERLYIT